MELKEYLNIIKNEKKLFFTTILIIILFSFVYFYLRPIAYETSLILNISRIGIQKTDQFRYDDFYRLQADEKFCETVVQWLKSPRVVTDILTQAGIGAQKMSLRSLSRSLGAEKLSAQVVSVSFSSPSENSARKIAEAISKVISKNTQSLNADQNEETWFEIIPQDPVISRKIYDPWLIFLGSLLAGIFIGFWIVMIKHYLK